MRFFFYLEVKGGAIWKWISINVIQVKPISNYNHPIHSQIYQHHEDPNEKIRNYKYMEIGRNGRFFNVATVYFHRSLPLLALFLIQDTTEYPQVSHSCLSLSLSPLVTPSISPQNSLSVSLCRLTPPNMATTLLILINFFFLFSLNLIPTLIKHETLKASSPSSSKHADRPPLANVQRTAPPSKHYISPS